MRPGLTGVSRALLTVFTFGSDTIRNAAYSMAALGVEPGPALVPVYILSVVTAGAASTLFVRPFVWQYTRKRDEEAARKATSQNPISEEEAEEANVAFDTKLVEIRRRGARRAELFLVVGLMFWAFVLLGVHTVLNQAGLIRRVFFANLAITAPYLTTEQEELLRAQFAAITTRTEYAALDQQIRQVAEANGVRLREEQLW
ncbi:MAG: hypothetical protein ACR2H9_14585 [Longimicrobiaceae bacterium]